MDSIILQNSKFRGPMSHMKKTLSRKPGSALCMIDSSQQTNTVLFVKGNFHRTIIVKSKRRNICAKQNTDYCKMELIHRLNGQFILSPKSYNHHIHGFCQFLLVSYQQKVTIITSSDLAKCFCPLSPGSYHPTVLANFLLVSNITRKL